MNAPTVEELTLLHSHLCQALGETKRIEILYALYERPRHVSALAEDLGYPQPTISRHLKVLKQCTLVSAERDGASVIYQITDERIIEILNDMRNLLRDVIERQNRVLASEPANMEA
ncbi:MAG: winged helix-turn-helix transcriptional regulator [Anaerolineales bacterium]|nr:winged helix-turn-helix transcriptional regulator [Anaerolineales bacterium]